MDINNVHALALNFAGVGDPNSPPLYFVKSPMTVCHEGSEVPYPIGTKKMWSEVELGIRVAKDCENVEVENAIDYIEGFTVCGDVTCSNVEGRDHHLAFSKSRKNFCPTLSSVTRLDQASLEELNLKTRINGIETQNGGIQEMKLGPLQSFSFVSKLTPLKRGDLILTGTPKGVENNILKPGDLVEHEISGIGTLKFSIS